MLLMNLWLDHNYYMGHIFLNQRFNAFQTIINCGYTTLHFLPQKQTPSHSTIKLVNEHFILVATLYSMASFYHVDGINRV